MLDVPVGMSVSQREVWLDQCAWPDSAHLNVGGGAFLCGPFNLGLFKSALQQLVAENEALRLVPRLDGSQILLTSFEPELEVVEVTGHGDSKQAMRDWWNKRIQLPVVLGNTPPWRFTLLHANDNLHGLTIQFHHLVMDGWGTSLVMQRWSRIYNALELGGVPPTGKDPGYVAHIRESAGYHNSPSYSRDALFWCGHLAQPPAPIIDLRFPQARNFGLPDCDLVVKSLPRTEFAALANFAALNGATAFNVFAAAIAVYFSKLRKRQEIVVGIPSLNRGGRRYHDTMGMFVGVMAIKIHLTADMTTRELLAGIAATMRACLRHPRFPLSEVGRRFEIVREGRDGIFDVLLSYERQDFKLNFGAAQLQDSRQLFSGKARYPLGVTVCEFHEDEDVELILEGSHACFEQGETGMLANRLWALVKQMMASPETPIEHLSLVPTAEFDMLVTTRHQGLPSELASEPYILQFERQAALNPTAIAIVWGGESMQYASLDARAAGLAQRLNELGAARGGIVAFAIERSVEMVISVLAISKIGAAFLPIDPDIPVARISEILSESAACTFLIKAQDQARLGPLHPCCEVVDGTGNIDAARPVEPVGVPSATDLAYVLFTSGSTGRPKGVMIDHDTLARRLRWLSRAYGVTAHDRSAQATQITFDPSLIELCLPLVNGASVALAPPGRVLPESLADFAIQQGVTIMAFVPSTLSRFLDAADGHPGLKLRVSCCGGEVMPPELSNRYLAITKARLFNVYGPTETAIFATAWECEARPVDAVLPIGKPISDSRIYVLDEKLHVLPTGVTGEIHIGGRAVAAGYLNRPELTAVAFLDDPFQPGSRMYKTGDRGWVGVDGNLHFVGRIDRQIKLRGYRIELGEIEAALSSIDGVTQAAAKLTDRDGKPQIHAWVAASRALAPDTLQKTLRMRLPSYMIPGGIDILQKLPESSAGKIDYFSLPTPRLSPQPASAREPENQLETDLLALWRKVLDRRDLNVSDNFFDAGGDSLAAVSILTGIEKIIGRRVPMYLITERPTVEGLAAALGEGTASTGLMVKLGSDLGATATRQLPKALLYLAASGHGDLMRFQALARSLGDVCEVRMLQPPSASTITKTVDLAELYAKVVVDQGGEPCFIAGFSVGGLAALETAQFVQQKNIQVKALFLIDTIYPSRLWGGTFFWRLLRKLVAVFHIEDLSMNGRRLGAMLNDTGLFSQVMAVGGYRPSRVEGNVHLVKSRGLATRLDRMLFLGWRQLMRKQLHEHQVSGLHGSMFDDTNIHELASVLRAAMQIPTTDRLT